MKIYYQQSIYISVHLANIRLGKSIIRVAMIYTYSVGADLSSPLRRITKVVLFCGAYLNFKRSFFNVLINPNIINYISNKEFEFRWIAAIAAEGQIQKCLNGIFILEIPVDPFIC